MTEAAVELACQSSGAGEPLIILHGLFGSGTNWRGLARRFEKNFQVHLVDARNHGNSPHASTMDYVSMAADVSALLDRLGLETAHVIGHSMGGKTAMTLALNEPSRVRSLLVADVAPVAYAHRFDVELAALRCVDLDAVASRTDADRELASQLPDAGLRGFLLQNLVREQDAYRWRVNFDAIDAGVEALTGFPEHASTYDGPTLFLRGALSHYVLDDYLPTIHRLFPEAVVESIEGAGHWLHAEDPERFFESASAHLRARA